MRLARPRWPCPCRRGRSGARYPSIGGIGDDGTGAARGTAAPGAYNPDYILYGKAIDMPNRSTNFYLLQFNIVNTHTRVQVWSRTYQVKVSR